LVKLHLPEQDRRLIVTFHYYQPFQFTHQDAHWVKGSDKWKGTTWKGTIEERDALRDAFLKAAAWASERQRPLYLGEFGVHQPADMNSRALWTRAVAREAEKQGFSWSYFDFGSPTFGAYDIAERKWRQPLLRALMNQN
jgi:endoglucanase